MGRDIYFKQGLPKFEPDLCIIDPCYNNIVVLGDLLDMVVNFLSFPNFSPKGGIEMPASYCCYKMHFRKDSTKPV